VTSFEDQYAEMLERWERAARGWGRQADSFQEFGMRVSVWMVEHLSLQPGQRVLDLAAGPGDTGFLAAELVRPGGTLISSDASQAMIGVARGRARDLGVSNVEFKRMELEWIDLDTASVDAALCRFGLMLAADPGAALQEIRRVLRPGGAVALAVWDTPDRNIWATIPDRALVELGHSEPTEPTGPGMFVLADASLLRDLLESAGFLEVVIDHVDLNRSAATVEDYMASQLDLSRSLADTRERLSDQEWNEVTQRVASLAEPYTAHDGSVQFPARTLVAAASA
jgi:ubiquinone/menaquinone biosynthesis C-methylase UbiE